MDVPSMVQRSGDTLIVRSVVSGNQIYLDQETGNVVNNPPPAASYHSQQHNNNQQQQQRIQDTDMLNSAEHLKDEGLPQCKIKRNYSCSYCTYFTQNPRYHLTHLRDVHGEKIVINKCKLCLYASRHYQKLVRHMKMVHGSTEGMTGSHGQSRKRNVNRDAVVRKRKNDITENGLILPSNLQQQLQQQFEEQVQQQYQQQLERQEFQQQQQLQQQSQHHQQQQQQQAASMQFSVPKAESPSVSIEDTPQNRLIKCSLCDFTTLYRAQLVDHEQEEHCRTKFFRCDKCNYVTHIKARYSKHVKYHSMPMIKCVTCDFRTPYKWNLDRHMKNHGGAGPFKCAACDFTADIKQSLTVHEMNHHVPPVGHAAGMSLARRRNKVGGTDILDEYLSDIGDTDDQFNNNNNNIDDFDESYAKKCKYEIQDEDDDDEEQPTDLSQKGGSSDAGSQHHQKKSVRPVPNLIPIQAANNALNLSKEFTPSRSTLKDIAALYFSENQIPEILMQLDKVDAANAAQLSPSSNHSTASKRKSSSFSFFDELKKSFADDSVRNDNLACNCGHVSKCLSESILHRKSCSYVDEDKHSSISPINLTVNCSGSTRCQHCRHRCKSSADLLNHLKNCSDAGRCQNDSFDSMSMSGGSSGRQEHDDDGAGSEDMSKHPMENRVFVWNKMPHGIGSGNGSGGGGGGGGGGSGGGVGGSGSGVGSIDGANGGNGSSKSDVNGNLDAKNAMLMGCSGSSSNGGGKNEDNSYYGVETAPGYGEVTKKMTPEEEAANSSLKKVYKCPHCPFWASTASRFHVHIVGHLNKKPFECSLCAYRSNWRWDITKHIRLKTIRDPSHRNARVLMNDETGRRNYTKYNKFITLMKVTDEDGDPKLMKSGEMTPNQVASMSFLAEFNKSSSESGLPNGLKSNHSHDGDSSRDNAKSGDGNEAVVDPNGLIRLASVMMNAAMTQQKEQQEQQQAVIPTGIKRSPPPLIKPSDDLITDIKTEGLEKKTFYKCRKCHFRHANRDAVLAHVKVHYQDSLMGFPSSSKFNHNVHLQVAINPTNLNMNKVLAAMCLSQKQLLNERKSPISSNNNSNNQHSILSSTGATISPKALAAIQAAGTTIEHGETIDEASSSSHIVGGTANGGSTTACGGITSSSSIPMATGASNNTLPTPTSNSNNNNSNNNSMSTISTTGCTTASSFIGGASNSSPTVVMGVTSSSNLNNDNNEKREPSPFRCGHCYQVSNWKHVIQRHCRLKHAGDIRIESLDRNRDVPVYRPLGLTGNGQSCHVLGPSADNYILSAIKPSHDQHHQQQSHNNNNNNNVLSKEDLHLSSDSSNKLNNQKYRCPPDLHLNHIEVTRIPVDDSSSSPSNKCKQQKCPSCPYISESKSQMNYHISLHKPPQYECNLCPFVCMKKQHLSNHVKAMHESTPNPIAAIDLRSKHAQGSDDDDFSSSVISYCPKCPSRFVNCPQGLHLHLKAHGANLDYKCEVCDYSTKQETVFLSHSFVHTNEYQEKTERIARTAKEDVDYPVRKLHQISPPNSSGTVVWIVTDRNSEQSSFDNDSSLLKKQLETGIVKESPSPPTSASPSSSSISETNELEKCSHCPFQSTCRDTFKRHLQQHVCVSNQNETHTCEHCDFSTSSEVILAEHTRIHFETMDSRKSVAFFTSYDNLELTVTSNDESKSGDMPKLIKFNCDSEKSTETSEGIDDEINGSSSTQTNTVRRSSRSNTQNGGDEKVSPAASSLSLQQPPSSHKTILVNPKTGQVIRRN